MMSRESDLMQRAESLIVEGDEILSTLASMREVYAHHERLSAEIAAALDRVLDDRSKLTKMKRQIAAL